MNEVNDFIAASSTKGDLPEDATQFIVKNPRCSRLSLLPKIHKIGNPGRPIVAACSSLTMYISQYVDYILQPLVRETSAFLKDTTDFLLVIKDVFYTGQTTLMTADVASLYTVIQHNDCLRALEFLLDQLSCQDPRAVTIF